MKSQQLVNRMTLTITPRQRCAATPVAKISKQMKRTIGALRQQAFKFGIGLGHQR
jgi:hypothetical protein